MKKYILLFSLLTYIHIAFAQENVYPAPKQSQPIIITNATIHIGNGQVLNNASVEFINGKITQVGNNITPAAGTKTIDATGNNYTHIITNKLTKPIIVAYDRTIIGKNTTLSNFYSRLAFA